ncbi:beta-galactosidase [Blautia coccoides]|uniref:Beta-galactosidase n=1 Tax=Blautia hominis TaxID=2025493 RepID=A0ABQ0BKM9_9FIRM|nr:beta-galactosidase [Blautia coccoides]MCQ4640889.1 beta-galactosidase [Blautia coccoides]
MAYGKHVTEILYGGDYNPEQWPREVWEEDMRMMRKAHINVVTLNVFSWASLQPSEDIYDFERLDEIMGMVRDHNLKVCMATSTGAHPAWMAKRHPDILRTEANGMKRKFGGRHNSCPNSPTYQKYAPRLAGLLAERYKNYDNIVGWHVSNEFGGECYCENCEKAFQQWLKKKYGTIEEVNRSFNTAFWGHTFYEFDEIVLPNYLSEHFGEDRTMFQGISLDYRRFMSNSMMECFKLEYNAIKKVIPDARITTNLMGFYKNLDYQKWAKYLDFISWDSYPAPEDAPATIAMNHDLMRGVNGQESFVLMEQTPSVTNWQPFNKLKRPGQMRLLSYEAMAHGADAIQFFQIRRTVGACEKYHGAVIDHAGREDTRVFREIETLGAELPHLKDILRARTPSEVAILFDWDNWWAVEYSAGPSIYLKYLDAIKDYYTAAFEKNVPVDIVSVEDELSSYKVVIAPLLYMTKTGVDEKLRMYVKNGGVFITTYFSGIVEEHDLVIGAYPGKLRDILGIWVEEQDALPEGEQNHFTYGGKDYPAKMLCDLMYLESARALSFYEEDFYQGTPVITENRFGKGKAYYVGTRSTAEFYRRFMENVFRDAQVYPVLNTPKDVEAAVRENSRGRYLFLLNHSKISRKIALPMDCEDMLEERAVAANSPIELPAMEVRIFRYK